MLLTALPPLQVCLFSYGQTGAGKTHTMQGTRSPAGAGIIPRSVRKVACHQHPRPPPRPHHHMRAHQQCAIAQCRSRRDFRSVLLHALVEPIVDLFGYLHERADLSYYIF